MEKHKTSQQQQPGSAWLEYTVLVSQGKLMLYDTRDGPNCYNAIPFDDEVLTITKHSCSVPEGSALYYKVLFIKIYIKKKKKIYIYFSLQGVLFWFKIYMLCTQNSVPYYKVLLLISTQIYYVVPGSKGQDNSLFHGCA